MSRFKQYMNNNNGFTLIELIISIALLGIISMIFVSMFGTGLAVMNNADEMTKDSMQKATSVEKLVTGVTGTEKLIYTPVDDEGVAILNGTPVEVTGQYKVTEERPDGEGTKDKGVEYKVFLPN